MSEIKEQLNSLESECDALMERLKDYLVSPAEAQELSTKFLELSYRVNRQLRGIKTELIMLKIFEKSAYSKAFDKLDNKINVSKAKALASADKEYLKNSIPLEKMVNEKEYWEGVMSLFKEAHIFYRGLCRD